MTLTLGQPWTIAVMTNTTEPALAITTTDLRKAYGGKTVLDGIGLRAQHDRQHRLRHRRLVAAFSRPRAH